MAYFSLLLLVHRDVCLSGFFCKFATIAPADEIYRGVSTVSGVAVVRVIGS